MDGLRKVILDGIEAVSDGELMREVCRRWPVIGAALRDAVGATTEPTRSPEPETCDGSWWVDRATGEHLLCTERVRMIGQDGRSVEWPIGWVRRRCELAIDRAPRCGDRLLHESGARNIVLSADDHSVTVKESRSTLTSIPLRMVGPAGPWRIVGERVGWVVRRDLGVLEWIDSTGTWQSDRAKAHLFPFDPPGYSRCGGHSRAVVRYLPGCSPRAARRQPEMAVTAGAEE
jgi:hypothetical protein